MFFHTSLLFMEFKLPPAVIHKFQKVNKTFFADLSPTKTKHKLGVKT